MITPQEAEEVLAEAKRLYTQSDVEQALDRLASEISSKLSTENPIILCVLNGALIPMGHLLTRLTFPLRYDYIHASRYRGEISGNDLKWIGKPSVSLEDETVLVIDDILDEGVTLSEIVNSCRMVGAKAVYTAVLVEKRHTRGNGFIPNFVGLEVEDRYVFGFGMDYKGYLRNAAGIFAVNSTD
ncbi:MAG: hypoxanthine-guanine phosphoribosyltransferase [Pseudomonadota bacterium]